MPVFLKVLSQHNEYYDLFFGDIITDLTWPAYYVIATNQLEVLKDYMMKPGVYTFSKEVVNHVVEQLALHQPERKEEVVQWYRDVLSFYNSASLEDNVIDGTLLAFMAGSLVKVCGEETESIIKPLFDKGYVNLSVSGDLKSTIKYLKNGEPEVLNNMFDHYDYYSTMWQDDSWDDEDEDSFLDEEFDDYPFYYKQQQPVVNGPKIERNDPCPCGSGKKYKKCCLK